MIHLKLLEFQKKNITITKDGTNPHFKSKYSTLNEVLDKVKAPLNAMGVLIVQRPMLADGVAALNTSNMPGLWTELIDTEDDSKVSSFVPFVGATDMQKLGGAISYARRYSLVALLGLEDEDDDGNTASAPPKRFDFSKVPPAAPRAVQRPTGASQSPVARNDEPFPSKAETWSKEDLNSISYD